MNCQGKNKIVQKLAGYVLPYKWMLLFCLGLCATLIYLLVTASL